VTWRAMFASLYLRAPPDGWAAAPEQGKLVRDIFLPSKAGAYTPQLNLSAFYGIGGGRRGCVAHVKGMLGGL